MGLNCDSLKTVLHHSANMVVVQVFRLGISSDNQHYSDSVESQLFSPE